MRALPAAKVCGVYLVLWVAVLSSAFVNAEIVIDRTRVIYPMQEREVTVNLTNAADSPRLVQVWIDEGAMEQAPELSDVPFTVTPPILRMDAGKGQALRVMLSRAQAQGLVPDKESLFWLNVLGVKPVVAAAQGQNSLQFAWRSRIKLFVRPTSLSGEPDNAPQTLQWRALNDAAPALQVSNPSAYHVTLTQVSLALNGREYRNDAPPMLAPGAEVIIALNIVQNPSPGGAQAQFSTLDDWGSSQSHPLRLFVAEAKASSAMKQGAR